MIDQDDLIVTILVVLAVVGAGIVCDAMYTAWERRNSKKVLTEEELWELWFKE